MPDFADSVVNALEPEPATVEPVAGGDINRAWRIETGGGRRFFGKSRPGGSLAEFENEAAGLRWLAQAGALQVPRPIVVVTNGEEPGLVLEWLEPGEPGDEAELGRGLARIHQAGAEHFDQLPPGALGNELCFGEVKIPLSPTPAEDGFTGIYADRLRNLAGQAYDAGSLGSSDRDVIEQLAGRAGEFAGPIEPPARVHGDFWAGNVLWSEGHPRLIDPAAHGGHRELDLAMFELFGNPGSAFYSAYEEVSPLASDYPDRITFWQLQPLLVHAVLFGGGYGRAAAVIARSYIGT